jgi:murein L,D-transpeptidase YcbB/YkuD
MRTFLMSVSLAALLATGACDKGGNLPGDRAADAVAPKEVSAEELRAAVKDPRVQRFYAARQWKAAWNEDQARELTEALREAPRHGLEAVQFLKEGDAAGDPVTREAALSLAAVSYADALANGRIEPGKIAEVYTLPRPKVDIAAALSQAIEGSGVGKWLTGLAPQDEEYRALGDAFLRYSRAARGKAPQVAGGETLKPGQSDKRVPQIAEALRINGYLPAEQPAEGQQKAQPAQGSRYAGALVEGVKRLQADYGQDPDGVIGTETLEMLNTGAADRARTLAINLERRRWLARTAPDTRIDVNTAAAFLKYYRGGKLADQRRVVVGQPEWETPELGSPITHLVANPPWNVPESIEQDELAAKGAAYLAANGFTRQNGRLVQAPGPDTALGVVKFDMKNSEAIYLHDTPAKALFATDDRHASHGCVRVHNAVQFAQLLSEHDGKRGEFDKALASRKETSVDLDKDIFVRLLYHTAYLDNGKVVFRDDAYGWDDKLALALGLGPAHGRRAVRTHVSIIGP